MSSDDYEFNDEDEDEVLPTYQEYLDFDLSEDEELHRNLNNHGVSVTSYAQNQATNCMNAQTENGQHMRSLSATGPDNRGPAIENPSANGENTILVGASEFETIGLTNNNYNIDQNQIYDHINATNFCNNNNTEFEGFENHNSDFLQNNNLEAENLDDFEDIEEIAASGYQKLATNTKDESEPVNLSSPQNKNQFSSISNNLIFSDNPWELDQIQNLEISDQHRIIAEEDDEEYVIERCRQLEHLYVRKWQEQKIRNEQRAKTQMMIGHDYRRSRTQSARDIPNFIRESIESSSEIQSRANSEFTFPCFKNSKKTSKIKQIFNKISSAKKLNKEPTTKKLTGRFWTEYSPIAIERYGKVCFATFKFHFPWIFPRKRSVNWKKKK